MINLDEAGSAEDTLEPFSQSQSESASPSTGQPRSDNSAVWTTQEAATFEEALQQIDNKDEGRWEKLAAQFPDKSVEDMKNRVKFLSSLLKSWTGTKERSPDAEGGTHGLPWSQEEHMRFLEGLAKYGKGQWRRISRLSVHSRTPAQVASHAQKYFYRQQRAPAASPSKKSRRSIHDMTMPGAEPASQPSPQDSLYGDAPVFAAGAAAEKQGAPKPPSEQWEAFQSQAHPDPSMVQGFGWIPGPDQHQHNTATFTSAHGSQFHPQEGAGFVEGDPVAVPSQTISSWQQPPAHTQPDPGDAWPQGYTAPQPFQSQGMPHRFAAAPGAGPYGTFQSQALYLHPPAAAGGAGWYAEAPAASHPQSAAMQHAARQDGVGQPRQAQTGRAGVPPGGRGFGGSASTGQRQPHEQRGGQQTGPGPPQSEAERAGKRERRA